MATRQSQNLARLMAAPSILILLGWMIIPLSMTVYFSFLNYSMLSPEVQDWIGLLNYEFFLTDPAFFEALSNTLIMVFGVLLITIIGGLAIALLLEQSIWGQGVVRVLVISPFFIMPTVSALIWKNMFMNPVNGLFAYLAPMIGLEPFDFFALAPLASVITIVAWQWLPFSVLILLTALQSLDREQIEASKIDGAKAVNRFIYIVLPHLARAITVVVLIQTIFLLSVFAQILVTTNGGPGNATTTLTYLVYVNSLLQFDIGAGSAGGVIAVILANIVAIFLMRLIGKNLDS